MNEKERLGQMALDLVADYPLYASTSNISYDDAIAIAKILFGNDIGKAYRENKEFNEKLKTMSQEEIAELAKSYSA